MAASLSAVLAARLAAPTAGGEDADMEVRETRYAKTADGVRIAPDRWRLYRVVGL
jgi:hypothetical protein